MHGTLREAMAAGRRAEIIGCCAFIAPPPFALSGEGTHSAVSSFSAARYSSREINPV